jgi:signal-transduction protein with cAMP-binding, CBS, and nucleotidyltransferase domain
MTDIIRVQDVMHKDVLSIDGMASAKEAAAMMRESGVSELLVSKRDDDDAWGIVTVMDIIKGIIVAERDAETVFVYEIMTKPVITLPAKMDIRHAVRLLDRVGIRRAPVDDQGEIVGMVTLFSVMMNADIL